MGFTSAEAQVRIIPVYLAATVVSLTCAWLTDRFRCRYKMTLITLIPGITGYGIMLAGTSVSVGVRYFACFLTGITAFTTLPTVLAWVNYQVIFPSCVVLYISIIADNWYLDCRTLQKSYWQCNDSRNR